MNNQFSFLDYKKRNIEGKEFLVIYVFEFNTKQVLKIYKISDDNLISKLDTFAKFENINYYLDFVIKRDGKISLDIKL